VPTALETNASVPLLILAAGFGILAIGAIVFVLLRHWSLRGLGHTGEEALRGELMEISRRLAALERGMVQVVDALPRSVQGVGVVRYDAFPETGGGMSFSLALLDGRANGVVVSVLNHREGSRVYGKAVEAGTSHHRLSEEEQQALALARRSHGSRSRGGTAGATERVP